MVILGIDLGDKNSCISKIINTNNEIISNSQSKRTTPTMLSFNGKYYAGENVNNLWISNYKYSFSNFKKIMNLFTNNDETFGNNIIKRENNTILFKINEEEFISVEQIVAFYLEHLIKMNKINLENVEIVISVPCYYNETQRLVLYNAAKMIGIKISCLVSDYLATAINYSIFNFAKNLYKEQEIINIIDLGAYNLCFSNITLHEKNLKVNNVNYMKNFGGNSIDEYLVKYFSELIKKDYDIDIKNYNKGYNKLYNSCEKMKKDFSINNLGNLNIECFYEDLDINYTIDRDKYLEIVSELDNKLIDFLNNNCLEYKQFKTLIVGCGNRIFNFSKIISDFFGKNLSKQSNLEESTARGCGYIAAMLTENSLLKPINLQDIITDSIDIVVQNSKINKILFDKGFNYPKKKQMVIKKKTNFELNIKKENEFQTFVVENVIDYKNIKDIKIIANINLSKFLEIEKAIIVEEKLEEILDIKDEKKNNKDSKKKHIQVNHEIDVKKITQPYLADIIINEFIESYNNLKNKNNRIILIEQNINNLEEKLILTKEIISNDNYKDYINNNINYNKILEKSENFLYSLDEKEYFLKENIDKIYKKIYAELNKITELYEEIENNKYQDENRDRSIQQLEEKFEKFLEILASDNDTKFIDDDYRDKMILSYQEKRNWLDDQINKQKLLKKYDNTEFTVQKINFLSDSIEKDSSKIKNILIDKKKINSECL